jgi:hypothetical protein
MDQVTQRNATGADAVAHAADELRTQVAPLRQEVDQLVALVDRPAPGSSVKLATDLPSSRPTRRASTTASRHSSHASSLRNDSAPERRRSTVSISS